MLTALRVTLVSQQVSAMKNVLRNLSLALKDPSCPPTDPMTSCQRCGFCPITNRTQTHMALTLDPSPTRPLRRQRDRYELQSGGSLT